MIFFFNAVELILDLLNYINPAYMRKSYYLLFLVITITAGIYLTDKSLRAQIPVAGFSAPDTVCLGQTVNISNTSIGGNTFYWSFCTGNMYGSPGGNNLGNTGNLSTPVFLDIAKDGNDYYVFVVNHTDPSSITRLFYGNSLLNVPTGLNMGNLSGTLPAHPEGIQIVYDGTNWYGFIVQHTNPRLLRLNFGTSLANIPTVVNFGNIGNMNGPHDLFIIQEGSNWYGLAINSHANNQNTGSITRFDFGNSLVNTPTGVNLRNIGGLNYSDSFFPINENGNWYLFITNGNNSTITRMDFGNSIANTPTGVNLGNIGALNGPRDIIIIKDCDSITGYVANGGNNTLLRIDFNGGLTGTLSGTNLGNIGTLTYPHSFSEVFRVNDTLYTLIPNAFSNSISKIFFPSCTNPSVNSSNLINPPSITYNSTGTYNLNLIVDENTPFQSNYCKEITVIASPVITTNSTPSSCGQSNGEICVTASNGTKPYTYQWTDPGSKTDSCVTGLLSGIYQVTVTDNNNCTATTTAIVNDIDGPIITTSTTSSNCNQSDGEACVIAVNGTKPYVYYWDDPLKQIDSCATGIPAGIYQVTVSDNNNCTATAIAILSDINGPGVTIDSITPVKCAGGNDGAIYTSASGAGPPFL